MIPALKRAGWRLLQQANGAIVVIFMVVAALALADEVEGGIFPILRNQATEASPSEDPTLVCWHWSFTKAREARPLSFSWTMQVGDRRYAITPLPSGRVPPLSVKEIEQGAVVDLRLCTTAPSPRLGVVVITGHAYYRTHGFWSVRQDFAPALVP